MKVLYLLNRVQHGRIKDITQGKSNDNPVYGMLRLPKYGVQTGYVEIESYLPQSLAGYLRRKLLNIYWVHLPLFFTFFAYDAVFASMAFGSQFLHTLYPFKKPKWVMLDFSLSGLIGEGKTLKQKILSFMVARANGIVTIDAREKIALEKRFPQLLGKIEFIPFAVDTDSFKPRPGADEEGLIFSPGRDPGRDLKTLFQATHGMSVRIVLTARSSTIEKLQPLPSGVTNANLSAEEYAAMLAKASIIVIPLNTKGGINNAMGISTLVEALAMGKAVIATRTHSTESYVEDGLNGLLVPEGDAEALREAILGLLRDPGKRERLGRAAREFAVQNCNAEGFARQLADYFNRILT